MSKLVYRHFNRTVKRSIRNIAVVVPSIAGHLDTVVMMMKIAKHVGMKYPFKYHVDLIDTPYGVQLRKRDTAFFKSDAFQISGFSELTEEIKKVLDSSKPESIQVLWENIYLVTDATEMIFEYKSNKMQG